MEYTQNDARYYHDIGGALILFALTSLVASVVKDNYYIIGGMMMIGFITYSIGIYALKNPQKERK